MNKTLIIAEAGVNHNGDINLAKKMIDVAAEAGVDYIKFQTFKAENIVTKSAQKAAYQMAHTGEEESQFDMIKKLELDRAQHELLIAYCKKRGVQFLSTAFDLDSVDLLEELGIDLYKIPSGEITNLPYLQKIGAKKKPIILSTGMSTLGEIETALNLLYKEGITLEQVTVLHCNTEYPTPIQDVNLTAMNTIRNAFKVKVGYSDHTLGIEVPIAAVALGAVCIEKHFTLDREMEGPDHKASLEPIELKAMVQSIRNIEMALGDGIKRPSNSEMQNKIVARKSIVASKVIYKGEKFTNTNLCTKRPSHGISPMRWNEILGTVAKKNFAKDELIEI